MKIILALIALLALGMIIWRLLSKRHSLPCPSWLGWMVEIDNPFTKVNRAASIISHLSIRPDMMILDAGCGPGRLAIPIAEQLTQGQLVALDIQQSMLDKTKHKAQQRNLNNITYLNCKLGENKLENEKFDRIVLVTVLGEIPDQTSALSELFSALKPGGILSVTELIFDPHFQTQKHVLALANSIGFIKESIFGNAIAYTLHLKKPDSKQ